MGFAQTVLLKSLNGDSVYGFDDGRAPRESASRDQRYK